ncbi:hypothetical protein NFI96_018708 [Prochilodus magdalenae]|nr:hypothetical protein NFI96_018708 [Prochilodus magdalenae]
MEGHGLEYHVHKITNKESKTLPFILCDVMGLEQTDGDGITPEDIENALQGRVKVGYTFNPIASLSEENLVRDSSLKDKVHCLMQECSDRLGPPLKDIFPVSNYHEEIKTDNTKDVLILTALLQIVKSARWHVEEYHKPQDQKECLETKLTNIQLNHPEIRQVRILLCGPVGAGKSCFINSVQSVFHGEIVHSAYEESSATKSCTTTYHAYRITNRESRTLPFMFNDVMGLEQADGDGITTDDIGNALQGRVKDGYTFNPRACLSVENFVRDPSLTDKVHCLVSVVPASSISRMETGIIHKMETIRHIAMSLGIPHLVVMTKVDDDVCPLVKQDLRQIYRSRKIKEKMMQCSQRLGPPVKCIFPVSNYHEETNTNNTKDVLILTALLQIVKSAKEYVEKCQTTQE